jgi:hypothetical protein
MKLSRRRVLVRLGAAGALNTALTTIGAAATPGASGPQDPQSPQIQLDASLNLDRDDV